MAGMEFALPLFMRYVKILMCLSVFDREHTYAVVEIIASCYSDLCVIEVTAGWF